MAAVLPLFIILLFLPLSSSAESPPLPSSSDAAAASLLLLKEDLIVDASALSSWAPGGSSPCDPARPWAGIVCSSHGVITGLRLPGMGLSGSIDVDALADFKGLRVVDLAANSFSGPIPPFNRLPALKALYLSGNQFSGAIPSDFFDGLTHLKKLWLDGNALSGRIPSSLGKATSLMELRLDNNRFGGAIPALHLPALASFNVSNNRLTGEIPATLSRFNTSSFQGNQGLCGVPFGEDRSCAPPVTGGSPAAAAACVLLVLLACALVVGVATMRSRRQGLGDFRMLVKDQGEVEAGGDGLLPESPRKCRGPVGPVNGRSVHESVKGSKRSESSWKGLGHKRTGSSVKTALKAAVGGGGGEEVSELVMVNEARGVFGLTDLMAAAAEAIGSGGLGSAYKAVMGSGAAVVVKRMRDMNRVGKEAFDAEMRRLGRLRHPNVLPPLAFHFRKDEKLLVNEFVPKGSLLYILHGDRGPNHAALDWATRLKVARGVTQGLAFLHSELSSHDVPHGNLKSGNVLLTHDFDPLLVDYGFLPLVNPSQASVAMLAFKSPEYLDYRHVSPKSDVFCLGLLLLELLTGKFPSLYLNNATGGTDLVLWANTALSESCEAELLDPAVVAGAKGCVDDMRRLLMVAVELVEADPDRRPDMKEAARRVEEAAAAAAAAAEREKAGEPPVNSHVAFVKMGSLGERSARRMGSIGDRSARRKSDDSYGFSIS